jgi:hypothetical protein
VWVESAPGAGATFWFAIPSRRQPAAPAGQSGFDGTPVLNGRVARQAISEHVSS